MKEEDELVEGYSLADWDSPPIYDIYPDKVNLEEEVSISADTRHVFDWNPKSEVPRWSSLPLVEWHPRTIPFLCRSWLTLGKHTPPCRHQTIGVEIKITLGGLQCVARS